MEKVESGIGESQPPAGPGGGLEIVDSLARLPAETILTESALASMIGRCKRSVQRMVKRGELPPGIAFAGQTVWLSGRILDHLAARAEDAAREAERELSRLKAL